MTNKKTDNSHLQEKIKLRLESVIGIDKPILTVLEAFSGDGLIWREVQKQSNKKISILKIEKKEGKKGVYLKGDNMKFISMFDFNNYDIIDLDAYGSPFNQLEVVFLKNFKGIVHCTFIQVCGMTGGNALHKKLLYQLGYTKEMIEKIPSLFNKNGFEKFKQYLAINGVKKIRFCSDENKHYLWSQIKKT